MAASDLERRIRWLETRAQHLARKIEADADAIGWANQQLTLARQSAEKTGVPPACNITITMLVKASCGSKTNAGLSGATVTVKRNSNQALLATGTTDASGNVSLAFTDPAPVAGSGTYDVQASKGPRWANSAIQTLTVACGGSAVATTRTLSPATGYVCCPFCLDPLPTTLHLTDSNGAITLTYNSTYIGWVGCYTKVQAGQQWNGVNACIAGQVQVAIQYLMACPDSTNQFRLTQKWSVCNIGSTLGGPGTCSGGIASHQSPGGIGETSFGPVYSTTAPAPNCTPLSVIFNMTSCNVNGSVTITE